MIEMNSKKIIATLAVLAMLCVPISFVAEADASDDPLEEIDLSEFDLSELMSLDPGNIVNALINLHNEGFVLEFTEDSDANIQKVEDVFKDLVKIVANVDPEEIDNWDIDDDTIRNAAGAISSGMASSFLALDLEEDEETSSAEIGPGCVKLAATIPDALMLMLTGDETHFSGKSNLGELGFMVDVSLNDDVTIDSDSDYLYNNLLINIFGNESIKELLTKVIAVNNIDNMMGAQVDVYEDAVYAQKTSLKFSLYMYVDIDTNYKNTDSFSQQDFYFNVKIGGQMKGDLSVEMTKISGEGPENISTSLSFNKLEAELGVGYSNNGLVPLGIQINKIGLSAGYKLKVDDKVNIDEPIVLGTIAKAVSGLKIPYLDSMTLSLPDIQTETAAKYEYKETDTTRSELMLEIIEDTKSEMASEYAVVPFYAGGVTAVIGILSLAVAARRQ